MAANRNVFDGAQQGKNLDGFSSNSHWSTDNAGAWSDHAIQPGPKAGFHDPIPPIPVRDSIWDGAASGESGDSDDSVSTSLSGGTL